MQMQRHRRRLRKWNLYCQLVLFQRIKQRRRWRQQLLIQIQIIIQNHRGNRVRLIVTWPHRYCEGEYECRLSRLCGGSCALRLSNIYHYTVCYNGSNEHTLKSYNQRGAVPLDDEQNEALKTLAIKQRCIIFST